MFVIFGLRHLHRLLGSGTFYCPKCCSSQQYWHKRVRHFFALYFIPLIPLGTVGEYVQCQHCQTQFEPQVLQNSPPSAAELARQRLLDDLSAGLPFHLLRQKLINQGESPENATELIKSATKGWRKICPQCKFEYYRTVENCNNCGAQLPPADL